MTGATKPLPAITELTEPYWAAARSGRLVVQRCRACLAFRYPAALACDSCGSAALDWVEASGRGIVWSACEFHQLYFKGFAAEVPYAVVLIQLEEGPRMYSNLPGLNFDDIRIGMAVEAIFERVTEAVTLVKFRLTLPRF